MSRAYNSPHSTASGAFLLTVPATATELPWTEQGAAVFDAK